MRFTEFNKQDVLDPTEIANINVGNIANILDPQYREKIDAEITKRFHLLSKINVMVKKMAAMGSDKKDAFAYSEEWEKLLHCQTRLNDSFVSGARLLRVSRNHTIKL